jgi:hypothetical protein
VRLYIIGSLRNTLVPEVAIRLRMAGHEAFDDWYGSGPRADDHWRDYERLRGQRGYKEALAAPAAQALYQLDKKHIDRSDAAILVMPAGKSGHLEFGYAIGRGLKGYVLFDKEPERWDVMYNFATAVCFGFEELRKELRKK